MKCSLISPCETVYFDYRQRDKRWGREVDKLMFIGVLRLRRKRAKISNTVGVDVLGDPKMMRFDFVYGYAQILITEGFHQFYNCKSVRRGAPGTSPPTRFVCRHFVTSTTPIKQNFSFFPSRAGARFIYIIYII